MLEDYSVHTIFVKTAVYYVQYIFYIDNVG